MENRDLLPCPFCGGEANIWNMNNNNRVGCCGINMDVKTWNTRHPSGGLVSLDEDTIAICRETVGYLLVKANEIKNINAGNWVTFKKRAMALENLIEASQRDISKLNSTEGEI